MTENQKRPQQARGVASQLATLLKMAENYWTAYLLSALLLILGIAFRSFEPRILQVVVDYILVLPLPAAPAAPAGEADLVSRLFLSLLPELKAENVGKLLACMAAFYVLLSVFRSTCLFFSDTIKANCSTQIARRLQDKAFDHIQHLPLSYFTHITRGELIQRCTGDIDKVKHFLNGQLIALVRIMAIFGFAFLMMAMANLQYALICIAVGPLVSLTAFVFFRKERKVWKQHEAAADELNDLVQENLNGIRLVSAYRREEFEIEKFEEKNRQKLAMGLRHNVLHSLFWPLSDMLVFVQLAVSMIVGGYFAITGSITLGELLSFYTYIGMVVWPMRRFGQILSETGMAVVAIQRLNEVFEAKREPLETAYPHRLKGHIRFEAVSFQYKTEDAEALTEVSFEIKAGEKVAIIGPTGSGKTTLIKLLLRLYEPSQGRILLDGQPLTAYSRKSLRQKIGLALQKPFLFSTTIRNNIAYAQPEAEAAAVLKAAEMAQLGELHQVFPEGLETVVGEKGVTLSGGQKQRVALARTLLDQPDILVLDDITSALDTHTEQALFNALQDAMSEKTTLIISHRITSIQQADRILVMEQGRLVQQGTPEELARRPGYYQLIHRIQSQVETHIVEGR